MVRRPAKARAFQVSTLLAFTGVFLWPAAVQAYVDPGSGSMVVQLLLGGLAGVAVAVRVYWRRLVQRFRRKASDRKDPSQV